MTNSDQTQPDPLVAAIAFALALESDDTDSAEIIKSSIGVDTLLEETATLLANIISTRSSIPLSDYLFYVAGTTPGAWPGARF